LFSPGVVGVGWDRARPEGAPRLASAKRELGARRLNRPDLVLGLDHGGSNVRWSFSRTFDDFA
jgi:hypothetical protein